MKVQERAPTKKYRVMQVPASSKKKARMMAGAASTSPPPPPPPPPPPSTIVTLLDLTEEYVADEFSIGKKYKRTAGGTLIKVECEDEEDDDYSSSQSARRGHHHDEDSDEEYAKREWEKQAAVSAYNDMHDDAPSNFADCFDI